MPDREKYLHKIIRFLKEFKTEVELRNSINLYDINIHAEYFYRDLFNLVDGLGLKNLNAQTTNAAYIDLVDEESKIAIQVTSQNDNSKITGTIKGFFDNPLNKNFRLIVLLIAKKAKEYRTDFTEGGKYNFNHEEDIVDIERLLAKIADKKDEELMIIWKTLKEHKSKVQKNKELMKGLKTLKIENESNIEQFAISHVAELSDCIIAYQKISRNFLDLVFREEHNFISNSIYVIEDRYLCGKAEYSIIFSKNLFDYIQQ